MSNDEASRRKALPQAVALARGGRLHPIDVVPDFGFAVIGQCFDQKAAPKPGLKDDLLGPTAARVMRRAQTSVPFIRD